MIWKKMTLLKKGAIMVEEKISFEVPHLEKVKHFTNTNLKKYGHAGLVTTVRLYLKSMNFFKNKYQDIKVRIKGVGEKSPINGERKEISKFLKVIGDYKHKIREIKHKIKKEENL